MDKTNEIDDKTLDKTSCQICGRAVDVVNVGPPVSFWCQQCHDTNELERKRELEEIKQEMMRLTLPVILADGDGQKIGVTDVTSCDSARDVFLSLISTMERGR